MSEGNGAGAVLTPPALAWKNGQGIPKSPGRPKGSVAWRTEFERAIRVVEKAKKKPLMQHAIERAFKNDKVLPHILDRTVPKVADPNVAQPPSVQIVLVNFEAPVA